MDEGFDSALLHLIIVRGLIETHLINLPSPS
jgi:hypothetical protein